MIYPIAIRCTSHSNLDKYLTTIERTYPDRDESLPEAFCRILEEAAEVVNKLKDRPDKVVFEVSSRVENNETLYFEGTVKYRKEKTHERVSPSRPIRSKAPPYQLDARRIRPSEEEEIFLLFLKESFPDLEFKLENNSLQCNISGEWVRLKSEKPSETTTL